MMKKEQKTMLMLAMVAFMAMVLFVPGLTLAGDVGGQVSPWCFSRARVEKTGQTDFYAPGDAA